jgi:contact-dependent growth inhibition (CDI) system CdiI-like immunity protein
MKINFDLNRSLQELEGIDWGEPSYESSLVITCHRLHKTPLKDFKVEDLRRMIGQQISLTYLAPLALRELCKCPYADGDLYEGALLNAVLGIEAAFWSQRPDLATELITLINGLSDQLVQMRSYERNGVLEVLEEAGSVFLARCGIPGASLVNHGKPNKNEPFTDDDMEALVMKFSSQPDTVEKS